MPDTTTRGFRYPKLDRSETPDVPRDIKNLADDIDGMFISGTSLPAFGKVGREYYRTTDGTLWLDIGTAWVQKNKPTNGSVLGKHLALGTVNTTTLENLAFPGSEVNLTTSYARIARLTLPAQGGTTGAQRLLVRWRVPYFCSAGIANSDCTANFYVDYGTYGALRQERIGFQTMASQTLMYDDVWEGTYVHPPMHDDEFDVPLALYAKKNNANAGITWLIRTTIWFEAQWVGI
jgi:hypothetical protein